MRRWIIGFGLLVVSLIYGQVVFAHANLERSEPAPNSVLPEPPQEIRLWFSEPLEAEFSSITIRDSAGNTLETPASELDPNDSYQMVIRPGDVADGIYTISWRALSAADGHGTLGNFPITIGAAEATSASNIPAADTIQPDNVAIRWLNLTSLSMLVGAVGFLLFVWQPAITEDIANIEGQMRRLMWVAWVLVGISGIFALALQISIATGEPLFQNLDLQTISLLVTQTRYGTLWLVRMILWVGVGGALVFARGDRWFYWIALIIGMGILLTQSLHSHASAAPDIIPAVANDWLHLFSTALWIGGLIQFINVLFALRGNTSTAISSQLVGYFSNFARIAVLALIVSGIYAAWLHVGSVEGLLTTLYGQALLIKILLILPLLALAGINLVFTHQGLHAGREIWNKRLRGLVGAEITLAAALMLAVGVMTSIAPARSALAARSAVPVPPQPQPIIASHSAENLNVNLNISPGWTGENTFRLTLTDANGSPIEDASRIRMRFVNQTQDLGESELRPEHQGNGVYSVSGANLSATGQWRIRLTIQRPDQFDTVVDFEPTVGAPPAPEMPPKVDHAPMLDSRIVALLIMGLAAMAVGGFVTARNGLRLTQGGNLIAGGLALCGLIFLVSGLLMWQSPPVRAALDQGAESVTDARIKLAFGHQLDLPYLVTSDGKLLQPSADKHWQVMSLNRNARDIYIDAQEQIWAATDAGLQVFRDSAWSLLDDTPLTEIEMTHGYLFLMGEQFERLPADGDMNHLRPLKKPNETANVQNWVMLGNHNHVVQNGDEVFITPDLGLSWQAINAPVPIQQITTNGDGQLVAVTQDGLLTWDNQNWQETLPLPDGKLISAAQVFNNRFYAIAGGKLYRGVGDQWQAVSLPDSEGISLSNIHFQYPDHLWVVDEGGNHLWSSQDGENWAVIPVTIG